MKKKIVNVSQKLYNTFISYCDETPNIFSTDNSVVLTDSKELFDIAYTIEGLRQEKNHNGKIDIYVPSKLSKNDFTPSVQLDQKYKYVAYVEADEVMKFSKINSYYDREFIKNVSLVVSDNPMDMKNHLIDLIEGSISLYGVKDNNLLEELSPRMRVSLCLNNKEKLLGDKEILTKFQALNFRTYLDNVLEDESEPKA